MGVLSNLEPASVFYYFEEMFQHSAHLPPRKGTERLLRAVAKAHGLACRQDEMGNVLIKAPATPGYEKEPGLIRQGHLDMVGDEKADCPLDLREGCHPPGRRRRLCVRRGHDPWRRRRHCRGLRTGCAGRKGHSPPCAGGRADRLRGGGSAGCICHGFFRP